MSSGIYKIQHKESGKVYIGSAKNLDRRIKDHKYNLNRKSHANRLLQRSWNKYGSESFEFSIILICDPDDRILYEQICIDGYRAYGKLGFNLRPRAENNTGAKINSIKNKNQILKMWADPEFRKKRNVPEPGGKYGRLTLVRLSKKTAGSYTWLCKCDCGKETFKRVGCLRNGNTLSCGCLNAELASQRRKERTGVATKFVEIFGETTPIRMAEKRLSIGVGGITKKARVNGITLQQACDYFVSKKGLYLESSSYIMGQLGFAA